MLKHPTLDGLQTLKLSGMVAALADQMATPDIDELAFEERLGLLVDREITERENRRLTSRLRRARLRHAAALEDIDYRNPRGLDKGLIQSLATCQWAKEHLNILIIGPTGVGKTWLACALAHKACREGYTVQYLRLTRLLRDLMIAKGDGRYPKLLANLAKVDVLLLDDWGLMKLNAENRRDLLEVLEDRHGRRSTIATSQLPIEEWHAVIGDPTLADAILDRLEVKADATMLPEGSMDIAVDCMLHSLALHSDWLSTAHLGATGFPYNPSLGSIQLEAQKDAFKLALSFKTGFLFLGTNALAKILNFMHSPPPPVGLL